MGSNAVEESDSLFQNVSRTCSFWQRATSIYLSYKAAQLKALALSTFGGRTQEEIEELVWRPQHEHAGEAMYDLCVSLRGFYLKAGQFIGSRNDFVPEAICRRLCLLMDKVPPMPGTTAAAVIQKELGVRSLSEVFEWIDLDKPLGSASVAQVHKAKLRTFSSQELRSAARTLHRAPTAQHTVQEGQGAWELCNDFAVSPQELIRLNKGINLDRIQPGQLVTVPSSASLDSTAAAEATGDTQGAAGSRAVAALLRAQADGDAPANGLVAVKVQYPNALGAMSMDLQNLRAAAFYLSKTEIAFDLVSAVNELNRQIRLEFDFTREARVMDTIARHLSDVSDRIVIPRSIPGLVSRRLLVMHFLEGIPLLDASKHLQGMSEIKQRVGKRRILERVSEAYGRQILGEGLFQADGHPGNILIGRRGRIGLLDYGQSKQLSQHHKLALARLIIQLDRGDACGVSHALGGLGVVTVQNNVPKRAEMAYGMFDTRGKVDPFDPDSPIKSCGITSFPSDLFFVLRVVQLLRGMANGMGINDFSCAKQWTPLAKQALKQGEQSVHGNTVVKSFTASAAGHSLPTRLVQGITQVALFPFPWVRNWNSTSKPLHAGSVAPTCKVATAGAS